MDAGTMKNLGAVAVFGLLPFVLAAPHAQAAKTAAITFSCDGKISNVLARDSTPEVMNNVGLVVNLTEKNVSFAGYVAPIVEVDATIISFGGSLDVSSDLPGEKLGLPPMSVVVSGDIDRVTGAFEAMIYAVGTAAKWDLFCKPTKSLF